VTTTTEHQLQQQILDAIGSQPGVLVWRQNVGVGRTLDGRHARWGTPGQPDICAIVGGRFIGIEVKRPRGGRQSAAQRRWEAACVAAGGVYIVCRDVDAAVSAVKRLRAPVACPRCGRVVGEW